MIAPINLFQKALDPIQLLFKPVSSITVLVMILSSALFINEAKSQNYTINYSVSDLHPQSIVYYPANKKFIVSSINLGQLGYIDDEGNYKLLIKDTLLTGASKMLVKDNFLYVLTNNSTSSTSLKPIQPKLVKVNLKTKSIVSIQLAQFHIAPQSNTNIAIDDNGTLYITDDLAAVIYKVGADGTQSILLSDKLLSKAKSIVFHKNGYLIVAADGDLYKINLSDKSLTKVFIEESFNEINNLHFSPNYLLVLAEGGSSNKVHILNSSNSWGSANLLRTDTGSFVNPNSIEYVKNKIYVLDTQLQPVRSTASEKGDFSVHVIDLQKRPRTKGRKGTVTVGELETNTKK